MPLRSRTRTRSSTRPVPRRISPCYRHPDEPLTGICASCLRERLSGLDSSIATTAVTPELRRSKSGVSASRFEASSSGVGGVDEEQQRRKSCDVLSNRSSLSNLFDVDDLNRGSERDVRVESKNVGLSSVTYTVIQSEKKSSDDEIRVSGEKLGEMNSDCVDEEFKTMKEYIDLEYQNKVKKSMDLREIAGNFLGAASVFTKKLTKWKQKNTKAKKLNIANNGDLKLTENAENFTGSHSDIVVRRSCDTQPRYSVDAGRISFEEPRASWDGYMIARTIPRLTPMFSVVEDGVLGNVNRSENRRLSVDGPMHSIVEDESSSGHSISDSSSSRRQSSFDRSSSVRSFGKKAVNSEEHMNVKLVITEKELKDWRLGTSRDDDEEKFVKTSIAIDGDESLNLYAKRSVVKWRGVRSLFGLKVKNGDNENEVFDERVMKLTRTCSSSVGLRNSSNGVVHGRRSVDNVDGFVFKGQESFDVPPPFYMTPLRSLKNNKAGKYKVPLN